MRTLLVGLYLFLSQAAGAMDDSSDAEGPPPCRLKRRVAVSLSEAEIGQLMAEFSLLRLGIHQERKRTSSVLKTKDRKRKSENLTQTDDSVPAQNKTTPLHKRS